MKNLLVSTRLHPLTQSITYEYKYEHTHSSWEIVLLLKGENITKVNGKTLEMHSNGILILSNMCTHKYEIKTKPYEHRDIYLSDDDMKKLCASIDSELYSSLIENEGYVFYAKEEQLSNLDYRLKLIESVNPVNLTKTEYSIIKTIISYILGLYIESKNKKKNCYPDWIQNLMFEMDKPDIMKENLDYIVKISNYSHEHLCRLFKKITGQRLNEYFIEKKMNHAVTLLLNTDYSVTRIATEIGYDSESYFIKSFKKFFGKTPNEYRKMQN